MSQPRTLPLRPRHIPGEAFGSFVERLARDLNLPLSSLLKLTGFISDDSFRAIPVGYGVALTAPPLEALATATRLSVATLRSMLLAHYDGIALDLADLDPAVPDTFRRAAVREWAYFSSTRVCPACIAENDGALLLRWRLPWSFACVKHKALLADTCPHCGYATGSGRRDGRTAPAFLTRIPTPGRCANPMPTGFAYAGRSAAPCGFPLAELPTTNLPAASPILAAQRRLDALLDGETDATVAGETVSALSYFGDLRSLVALILHVGTRADLGSLTPPCADAWDEHAAERESTLDARASSRARGEGRTGPRMRLYLSAPTKASLVAAVAPAAMQVLAAPTAEALVERLSVVAERARELGDGLVYRLDKAVRFSEPVGAAWQDAVDSGASRFSTRAGLRRLPGQFSFDADAVPQLIWPEVYASDFADFFQHSHPDYARRFCSVALVKLATGATWSAAGTSLGLDGDLVDSQANNLVCSLTKSGRSQEYGERLLSVAQRLDRGAISQTNYGDRRRAFSKLALIPPRRWAGICTASSIRQGGSGRRRWASVWVWCELTGNDFRLHRDLQGPKAESRREMYRRFLARELPVLSNALAAYASSLAAETTQPS